MNTVNITDNGTGTNASAQLDLTNGPFRDAGGAELEFNIDLNDGADGFFIGSDPGAMNFRFGTFLGVPFVNRNAGTDNTPDTVIRDTESFTAFGGTQGDVFTTLGPPGRAIRLPRRCRSLDAEAATTSPAAMRTTRSSEVEATTARAGVPGRTTYAATPAPTRSTAARTRRAGRTAICSRTSGKPCPVSVNLATTAPQNTGPGSGVDTITGVERVEGGNAANTLIGNDQDNELLGRSGDDLLEGRGGDDLLDGNAGVNTASYETYRRL